MIREVIENPSIYKYTLTYNDDFTGLTSITGFVCGSCLSEALRQLEGYYGKWNIAQIRDLYPVESSCLVEENEIREILHI